MDAHILKNIDHKVDSIIKNQSRANEHWDFFMRMDKRLRENEIALICLQDFNDKHVIKHWIIYALIALLFVLTAVSWMLR